MTAVSTVAVIGAGLIGCSWGALFAASGRTVKFYDSNPEASKSTKDFWEAVKPALIELNLATADMVPDFRFPKTLNDALEDADFIQECIPERLDAKLQLYKDIGEVMKPKAIVATSSSGFKLTDLQGNWAASDRLIIAHPFNPPHLIPLVELYVNERTRSDVLARASDFYESCGKVTITLKREVMGHVANRLQAALWREAISMVAQGVATLKDIDTAVSAGPGLRWAVMGPHMLLNLGGGEGGVRAYCEQFKESYHLWWNDLGSPRLTEQTIETLVAGLEEEINGRGYSEIRHERDEKLVAILKALKVHEASKSTNLTTHH